MKDLFVFLVALLALVGAYSLLTGRVWIGGQTYDRRSSRLEFYLGVAGYFVLAIFTWLFGKEL